MLREAFSDIKQFSRRQLFLAIIALFAFGVCCLFLYYMQSLGAPWDDSYAYYSDLPTHLNSALAGFGNTYSMNGLIFLILYRLLDDSRLLVSFLALVSVLTVFAVWKLLRILVAENSAVRLFWYSFACCFVMAIFIPGLGHRYIGTLSGTSWHNHTSIVLKYFSILAFYYFIKVRQDYLTKINAKNLILFTCYFTLATWAKPSFLVAFAPAVAIIFVVDLIKTRFRSLRNAFIVCVGFLPSGLIILSQNRLLYSDGNSKIAFELFGAFLNKSEYPIIAFVCSMLFPCLVIVMLWKYVKSLPSYDVLFLYVFIALTQYFLLIETGSRATHNNFIWVAQSAVFFLFIFTVAALNNSLNKTKKEGNSTNIRSYILTCVFGLHVVCGIWYFVLLLLGHYYYA